MAKKNLNRVAYDYLYRSIVTCKYLPGEAIVEHDVTKKLGISRTPVREALRRLSSEGFVRQIPMKGSFVRRLTTHDIEDIFELRLMFEESALRSGFDEISAEELAKIEDKLKLLNDDSDPEDFYESDRMLHEMIIKHAKNKRMISFFNTIDSQLETFRYISAMNNMRLKHSKEEHMKIVTAIKDKDLDSALKYLRLHLENVKNNTLKVSREIR